MPTVEAPFDLPSDLLGVAVRTLLIYFFLLAALRLGGKRELGQLSLFEFIVILVISDAVQNAMVGQNTSIWGGMVAVAVLLLTDKGFAALKARSQRLRDVLEGEPSLLVRDGQVLRDALKREGVEVEELRQALREHGVAELDEVRLAVLETDGTISVVPRTGDESRTKERLRRRKPRALGDHLR
jgi:uncharacterized membrane protein YcaP (DUF421 family)